MDKKVVRNDIKLAAKVITNLDTRWNLWVTGENGKSEEMNQVLHIVTTRGNLWLGKIRLGMVFR